MIPLLIYSFREMIPGLVSASIVLALLALQGSAEELRPLPILFAIAAPAVSFSPLLLYSSKYSADFRLPVSRKAIYRAKMTALFIVAVIGYGILPLVVCGSRIGGLNIEIVRTTAALLAYILASVCVSVAIGPRMAKPEIEGVPETITLIVAACLVIAHGAGACFVYVTAHQDAIAALWLVPGLAAVSFFAYRKGRAVFLRFEVVPAASGQTLSQRLPDLVTYDVSPPAEQSVTAGTAHRTISDSLSQRSVSRQGARLGASPREKTASAFTPSPTRVPREVWGAPGAAYGSGRLERDSYRIKPIGWIFPFLMSVAGLRLVHVLILLLVCGMQLLFTAALSTSGRASFLLFWLIFFGCLSWLMSARYRTMIGTLPAAYPRRRLFAAMTINWLWPVVVWSLALCIWFELWAVTLVTVDMVAGYSFAQWLMVPPSPRHAKAFWVHGILRSAFAAALILLIGLSWLRPWIDGSFVAELLKQLWSYVAMPAIVQPDTAWKISGVLALLAVLFWGQAYKRFKYMEGVPRWWGTGQSRPRSE